MTDTAATGAHIDLADVKTWRLPESVAAKARLERGDVLINEGGDFEKLGCGAVWRGQIHNCLHQSHAFRVRFNQELLLPDFLALWAVSDFAKNDFMLSSKQSTNLVSIKSTQLRNFPILQPSLDEKKDVLLVANALSSKLEVEKRALMKLHPVEHGLFRDLFGKPKTITRIN